MLQENGLLYGFVIAAIEGPKTIPSLWDTVQRFRAEHSSLVPQHNLLPWVTADDGSYNLCHFWSNFEIGNLNFFRSPPYSTFFDYLDRCAAYMLLLLMIAGSAGDMHTMPDKTFGVCLFFCCVALCRMLAWHLNCCVPAWDLRLQGGKINFSAAFT